MLFLNTIQPIATKANVILLFHLHTFKNKLYFQHRLDARYWIYLLFYLPCTFLDYINKQMAIAYF